MNKYFNKLSFLIFIMIPFFKPLSLEYISCMSFIDILFDIWKLVSIGIIVFCYFFNFKITKTILYIILFQSSIVISSVINNTDLTKPITNMLLIVGFAMLCEISVKVNLKKFINAMLIIEIPLFLINFVLTIAFPNGLVFADLYTLNLSNPLLFLTVDNGFAKWILPFIALVIIKYNHIKKNKVYLSFIWGLGIISVVVTGSASAIFSYILFSIGICIINLLKIKKLPLKSMILIYIISFISVVLLGQISSFTVLLSSILGRSSTFSGRTQLWQAAIELIKYKPLFGYGYTSGNIEIWGGYFSSHNAILEILIHGGIFSFTLFLILIIHTIKRVKNVSTDFANIVIITLFTYSTIFLVETGMNMLFFLFIIFANNCKKLSVNDKLNLEIINIYQDIK